MPNLKDLKVRIGSVSSTQKITKAMKMVAAAKLRRAQEAAEAARPFSERMQRMLASLAASSDKNSAPPLLIGTGKDEKHLIVVVSSDRGLCGGFNTTLVKMVKQKVEALQAANKTARIICVGKKAYEQLKGPYGNLIEERIQDLGKSKQQLTFAEANIISTKILRLFEAGECDVCHLVYNQFQSAISQIATSEQLIPLQLDEADNDNTPQQTEAKAIYEFEPGEEAILEKLLPQNLTTQILHGMLESAASEHGARMTAMDNATRNAGDMIKRLTLVYNRTRQAAITKELIEIISGAEAV